MFEDTKIAYYMRLQKYLKVLILLSGYSMKSFAKLTGYSSKELDQLELGKVRIGKPEFIVIIETLSYIIYKDQNNALALALDCLVLKDLRNVDKHFARWFMKNEENILHRIRTRTPIKELEEYMFTKYGSTQLSPRLKDKPNGLIMDIIKEVL